MKKNPIKILLMEAREKKRRPTVSVPGPIGSPIRPVHGAKTGSLEDRSLEFELNLVPDELADRAGMGIYIPSKPMKFH